MLVVGPPILFPYQIQIQIVQQAAHAELTGLYGSFYSRQAGRLIERAERLQSCGRVGHDRLMRSAPVDEVVEEVRGEKGQVAGEEEYGRGSLAKCGVQTAQGSEPGVVVGMDG